MRITALLQLITLVVIAIAHAPGDDGASSIQAVKRSRTSSSSSSSKLPTKKGKGRSSSNNAKNPIRSGLSSGLNLLSAIQSYDMVPRLLTSGKTPASQSLSAQAMLNLNFPDEIAFKSGTFDLTRHRLYPGFFEANDRRAFESASMAVENAKLDAQLSRELCRKEVT